MNIIHQLRERGLIAQITHEDELISHLDQGSRTLYVGFDPTADSLTVGHLLPILTMARWQRAGHRVVALLGDGTAMVGDPTGKTDMRQMLTREQINYNAERFKLQMSQFLDLSDPNKGIMLSNASWLEKLNYLDFLREIGPHFSVNRMLTAESVHKKIRTKRGSCLKKTTKYCWMLAVKLING